MALIYCSECGKEISDKATTCPSCGSPITAPGTQPTKKKKALWKKVVIGIIALLVLVAILGKNDEEKIKGTSPAPSAQAPPTEQKTLYIIPASDLWKEFNANEVAANQKYKRKVVAIEGRIYKIDSSAMGYPEIVFDVEYGIRTVRCKFPKSFTDTIAKMEKGQKVIVIGKVITFTFGSMLSLDDCSFGEKTK